MLSSRMDWFAPPNRLARHIEARRERGLPILDLTGSNPTVAGLDYPADEIRAALASCDPLRYEPDPAGLPVAREAVAEYYAARSVRVDPADIVLTSGTSEAYSGLFRLLTDPGDDVRVPAPSYPLLEHLAGLDGIRAASYPLVYHDGWAIDHDALRAGVTPRTRAIVTVHPNNPTGSFLSTADRDRIDEIAADTWVPVIQDEVFLDYAFQGPDPARAGSRGGSDAPGFVLGGLSKLAGLPQMKLSWIVICGPRRFRSSARAGLEWVFDTYLSVGTPVQLAARALLRVGDRIRAAIRERITRNHERLATVLEGERACSMLRAEGGWYATLRVPNTRTGEQHAVDLLDDDGVLVQPGYLYDFPGEAYLVLSLLTPAPTFDAGLDRILARMSAG